MTASLTVFTPTFNRGYILGNLYDSLKRQTDKDFEWIIVDDYSSDNTEEIVKDWICKEDEFYINYKKIEHGGKHRAFNQAVKMAQTDAFFTVDSDDYLLDDAVGKIINWFNDIKNNDKFAGVSGLKGYTKYKPIGGAGDLDGIGYIDATNIERAKHNLLGDKAEIYKTSILRKYPFKEIEGELFITEATVWDAIALDDYKIRWHNEIIYITEYRNDGLTAKGDEIFYQNPKGWLYWLFIRSQYILEKDMVLEYMRWYIYNYTSSLVDDMPENFKYKARKIMEDSILSLNQYIEINKINSYAIYGLGNWGDMFWRIKERVNATLKIGIDENMREWKNVPVYSPKELYKIDVDLILVTQKNKQNQVIDNLNGFNGYKLFWRDLFI